MDSVQDVKVYIRVSCMHEYVVVVVWICCLVYIVGISSKRIRVPFHKSLGAPFSVQSIPI